ncbi:MAG: hypothetical protein A2487_07740 [Candidatus Raymondbacteria bacterium RifOxyC12_full_50_8]|uniref:Uncharacterized protein n=1 Tax=Candidatus Raymondbacteria bacterium RIFOXYD12_FULL_49_13 TaxID=1817890 RepID=A0A1F7F6U9_UNCRA|nr:MAG: hypothetical protein A2248_13220 [Candidatus Raymondbacteria bacterium RIFOXYA2_FULL_49_16]OGJ96058.1 MAG: hypothetical protein A2350_04660 [Candidatus Raymondbacteria bacterium RifOxyB12_full_50_8]OGJ99315.1 MAG: hypothetical protein A2487_07740 [Candidatus Raymondbacteria bacterium RifOxyC12_full_50_8]OGK02247.1 MAG: hypothetical protein A2519_16335 [Candidatus Raymondbacteria bacterium RIFOXYD12_FULL_49_13]OGP45140.1 MAG: hypothetical protein A2324_12135 [Candidatus Raymondbacteria b
MKRISVNEITEGMVLAKPVVGSGGNILLGEGTELRTTLISRLRNWGVPFVVIQSQEGEITEEKITASLDTKRQEVERVFEQVKNHPLMAIIYEATKEHFGKAS